MNKILTVSIPTYNRPVQLKKTLGSLLPQLTEECFLRIIDNHSNIPVKDYAESIISQFPDVEYEIVRNKINVGGDNNILRCFEYCETDWLWTLGDDDVLLNDSIKIILDDIKEYSNAVNINYYNPSSGSIRNKYVLSIGKENHLKNIDSFQNLIFMSTNIYNCKHIVKDKDLSKGFHYTYSCAAHWFVTFNSIGNNDMTILSNKSICINDDSGKIGFGENTEIAFKTHTFSNITFIYGFSTFMDLLTNKTTKNLIINNIRNFASWLTIDWTIRTLIVEYKKDSTLDISFTLKQLYNRFYKYFGLKVCLKFCVTYMMLVISPSITYRLIRLMYLKKRNVDLNSFFLQEKK